MNVPELRPLSLGELLDRTFSYYRRHFWLFVGIMAIPQVLIVGIYLLNLLLQRAALQSMGRTATPGIGIQTWAILGMIGAALIFSVVYGVLYTLALGATTYAVSEVHLGRPITAKRAYASMRGRFWRIVDLIFTIGIRLALVFTVILGVIFLPIVVPGGNLGIVGAILRSLLSLALIVAAVVYWVRLMLSYACAVPALLLENLKAGDAIKRSVALTKNNFARVFLIGLLTTMVSMAVSMLLQGPFFVLIVLRAIKGNVAPPLGLSAGMNIASGIGQALTAPLLMIALVLLYYDIRVRKEGFDLQVILSALEAQSPSASGTQVPAPTA